MQKPKKMQKKMLDMQEEVFNERGEQIERVNTKSAELSAPGTKIHYEALREHGPSEVHRLTFLKKMH